MPVAHTSVSWAPHRDPLTVTIPPPDDTLDLTMGDGAIIRVRRYARAGAVRLFVPNGNGFAVDGYVPFWGPLRDRSIYLQAMTLDLWPPPAAYGGPVKLIAADPEARGAPAPAFANRALAEEFGYVYEAIPGAGHLLQIQKPEECRSAMLAFLEDLGVR